MNPALVLFGLLLGGLQAEPLAVTTVGIEGRVAVVASEPLRARDVLEGDAVLLRVVHVRERGPQEVETELAFVSEVEGPLDLLELLQNPPQELESLPVRVDSLLPEEFSGDLVEGARSKLPRYPARWRLLPVAGLLWVLPPLWLLVRWLRRPREKPVEPVPPPSLAERLEPLLAAASRAELSDAGKAKLDRLMLEAWSERLGLHDLAPGDAIAAIRRDADAGAVLGEVERWLYAPRSTDRDSVRVAELLAPYRSMEASVSAAASSEPIREGER